MDDTLIIEFFGLPNTGKSTIIEIISSKIATKGINVKKIEERAALCPLKDKLHPSFNFWTLTSLMKAYLEVNEKSVDLLFVDRGLIDSIIWVNFLSKNVFKPDMVNDFNKLASLGLLNKNILKAYFLSADIEIILMREVIETGESQKGNVLNSEILQGYSNTYRELRSKLCKRFKIKEIETSKKNLIDIADDIYFDLDKELQNLLFY